MVRVERRSRRLFPDAVAGGGNGSARLTLWGFGVFRDCIADTDGSRISVSFNFGDGWL